MRCFFRWCVCAGAFQGAYFLYLLRTDFPEIWASIVAGPGDTVICVPQVRQQIDKRPTCSCCDQAPTLAPPWLMGMSKAELSCAVSAAWVSGAGVRGLPQLARPQTFTDVVVVVVVVVVWLLLMIMLLLLLLLRVHAGKPVTDWYNPTRREGGEEGGTANTLNLIRLKLASCLLASFVPTFPLPCCPRFHCRVIPCCTHRRRTSDPPARALRSPPFSSEYKPLAGRPDRGRGEGARAGSLERDPWRLFHSGRMVRVSCGQRGRVLVVRRE